MSSGSTTTRPRSTPRPGTRCCDAQAAPTPFMRHEYLAALHASGSAVPRHRLGTAASSPCSAAASCGAACALYLKSHSYGEYVFDWAWADAYQRHGLRLLPQAAGRRALHAGAGHAAAGARRRRRATLLRGGAAPARARTASCRRRTCCSSTTPTAPPSSAPAGCCAQGVQFHWTQDRDARRTPTSPTSSPACSATSARRSSRSGAAWPRPASAFTRARGRAIIDADCGTSSTAATRSPTARTTPRPT